MSFTIVQEARQLGENSEKINLKQQSITHVQFHAPEKPAISKSEIFGGSVANNITQFHFPLDDQKFADKAELMHWIRTNLPATMITMQKLFQHIIDSPNNPIVFNCREGQSRSMALAYMLELYIGRLTYKDFMMKFEKLQNARGINFSPNGGVMLLMATALDAITGQQLAENLITPQAFSKLNPTKFDKSWIGPEEKIKINLWPWPGIFVKTLTGKTITVNLNGIKTIGQVLIESANSMKVKPEQLCFVLNGTSYTFKDNGNDALLYINGVDKGSIILKPTNSVDSTNDMNRIPEA